MAASATRARRIGAALGALVFSIQDTRTVNIPVWAGIAAIVAGAVLLVAGSRKS